MCEELHDSNVSLQCPIAPGFHRVEHTVLLPSSIPPVRFGVHVSAASSKDEPLTCLNLIISFSSFSWVKDIARSAIAAVIS